MRRAANIDANQPEVVKALRAVGATVQHLHSIGEGCPDLLVGFRGINFLFELKDGSKPPSRRKLTEDEVKWHNTWTGQVVVIESAEQAVRYILEHS